MNELKLLPLYIILALFSGTALLYFQWPFYEQAVVMALASVPIMLFLSRKRMPLFLFCILLVSIGYAVQEPANPLASFGTYLLLSIFQFSLWSLADRLKQLMEDTVRLKEQRMALLQKGGELRVLTLQEFVEQALWLLKTKDRKERTWLLEVKPEINCPVQTGVLELAALGAITPESDLVTSKQGAVYLLVKETEGDSLQPFEQRLEKSMDSAKHSTGFVIKKTAITNVGEMGSLLE